MKTTIWKGAADRSLPTVYIHSVAGDGHNVWNRCKEMGCPEFNLVSIHDFDFEGELTPWPAPGVRKGLPMFNGNAEAHLEKLLDEISGEKPATPEFCQCHCRIFIGRAVRILEPMEDRRVPQSRMRFSLILVPRFHQLHENSQDSEKA